jgi:hypothetical protein
MDGHSADRLDSFIAKMGTQGMERRDFLRRSSYCAAAAVSGETLRQFAFAAGQTSPEARTAAG